MQLVVALPAGRGVAWWTERNEAGPIPGRWPYGLDGLERTAAGQRVSGAGHRVSGVEAVEVAPLGRVARQFSTRTLRAPRAARTIADRVVLCWDEALAPAMLNRVPAERRFAGVIWATDRFAATGETPELAVIRKTLLRLDGLWVLSRPQIEAVRSWLGPDCPPVHFLNFGVDADFYRVAPHPATESNAGAKAESTTEANGAGDVAVPCVVSVGGDRDRDPETLFDALELVLARRPDVRCVVQSKSERPAPAGVHKETFIPHDQVRRLYADASVVALATRQNLHGSGMTVSLEAMSVGRPVVTTGTPGMEDYVEDGVTGHLVAPKDPDALAARILELLDDPARAAAMGAAGRSRVLQRHTTDTMCAELFDIVSSH